MKRLALAVVILACKREPAPESPAPAKSATELGGEYAGSVTVYEGFADVVGGKEPSPEVPRTTLDARATIRLPEQSPQGFAKAQVEIAGASSTIRFDARFYPNGRVEAYGDTKCTGASGEDVARVVGKLDGERFVISEIAFEKPCAFEGKSTRFVRFDGRRSK